MSTIDHKRVGRREFVCGRRERKFSRLTHDRAKDQPGTLVSWVASTVGTR